MRTWKNMCLATALVGALAGIAGAQTKQTADQTQPQVGNSTDSSVTTVGS